MAPAPVNMTCPIGDIEVATAHLDSSAPLGVAPSPWFPGRYRATAKLECSRFCVRVPARPDGTGERHDHFEFNDDDLMSIHSARANAERMLMDLNDGVATVNDWRFTNATTRDIVEMKLDGPNSVHEKSVTRFSATDLEAVRQHYWSAENHNGAFRVVCISDAHAARIYAPHEHTAPVVVASATTEPYLHQFIYYRHATMDPSAIVPPIVHRDGCLLNNTIPNLLVNTPPKKANANAHRRGIKRSVATDSLLEQLQTNSSDADTSGSESVDNNDSYTTAHSNSVRAVPTSKRIRTQPNDNNLSGVTGISVSSDSMRFQVKLPPFTPGDPPIRKSFSVSQKAQRDGHNNESILHASQLHAYQRAREFHANFAPLPVVQPLFK